MSIPEEKLMNLRIEQIELEIARQKAPRPKESFFSNPILLAIAGAIATALTSLVTNQLQLNANRQLERDKLESSLILKAVESGDADQRVVALQFLVKAGLIADTSKKIEALNAAEVPQIQNTATPDDKNPSLEDLVVSMNAAEKNERIASVGQLIKIYSTNSEAVNMALEFLELPKLDTLSASGRINVLVFLRNTNEVAWSNESIARAKIALSFIRTRSGVGIEIGAQTEDAMNRLSEFLETIKE